MTQSEDRGMVTQGTHLLVRGGHEAQKLIHVAHGKPVGVEFHGSLHLLGLQEVTHHPGHAPPTGPGEERGSVCHLISPPCTRFVPSQPSEWVLFAKRETEAQRVKVM